MPSALETSSFTTSRPDITHPTSNIPHPAFLLPQHLFPTRKLLRHLLRPRHARAFALRERSFQVEDFAPVVPVSRVDPLHIRCRELVDLYIVLLGQAHHR